MSETLPVVRIKSTHPASQGAFVEINAADFDPETHEPYDAPDAGPRDDGPTVAEYVKAGYKAANYPPKGYASRSTAEEIAAAIAAESAPKDPLDELADWPDWRNTSGKGVSKLKAIAEAITGRTAADKVEAVAMIEAALKVREDAKAPPPASVPPPPPPPPV